MARAIEQLVETGQKIATADELADVVAAMVESQPSRTKAVLMLSAENDAGFGSGTELTRIDSEDKHGFTLKIRDTSPIAPSAAASALSSDDEDAPVFRPRRPRWIGVSLALGALLAAALTLFSRSNPHAVANGAGPPTPPTSLPASAAPEPRVPAAVADRPAPEASSATSVDKPGAKASGSGAGSRKTETHARAKEGSPKEGEKESAPRETRAPPASGATCRGQLHLYATHGWLLSGGPGAVQAPGRYDWPCGTYGLKAISRLDSGDVKSVTVTIREGTPGVVDLR
jgi:hypothetical protein